MTAELNGVPVGEASPVWLALPLGELPLELGEAEPDPDAAWLAPAVDGGVAPGVSPGRGVPGRGVVPAVGRGVAAVVAVGRGVARGVGRGRTVGTGVGRGVGGAVGTGVGVGPETFTVGPGIDAGS